MTCERLGFRTVKDERIPNHSAIMTTSQKFHAFSSFLTLLPMTCDLKLFVLSGWRSRFHPIVSCDSPPTKHSQRYILVLLSVTGLDLRSGGMHGRKISYQLWISSLLSWNSCSQRMSSSSTPCLSSGKGSAHTPANLN
jgi:hypothetical protein